MPNPNYLHSESQQRKAYLGTFGWWQDPKKYWAICFEGLPKFAVSIVFVLQHCKTCLVVVSNRSVATSGATLESNLGYVVLPFEDQK